MRLTSAIGTVLWLACTGSVLAQNGPSVAFGQVTGIPIPIQSVSGRFSSLNPPGQESCSVSKVSGRVVAPTLVLVPQTICGRRGQAYALVNVKLANPADAAQMVPGRQVDITANFKRALEARTGSHFVADYIVAEKAMIVGGDPAGQPAAAFTSYMVCQPPELDALAGQLGSDLCVQNTLLADMAANRPALETAARAPANVSPEDMVPGDANAIACGRDPQYSDRHLTAIACARGSYWAWARALNDPKFSAPAPP